MPDRTQTLSVERETCELAAEALADRAKPPFGEDRFWQAHLQLRDLLSQSEHQGDEKQIGVVVDFLVSWRFCPVATASNPSRSCLEDAAKQLLAALPAQPPAGEVERHVTALLAAVEPFTVDGGVSCGREEQDALVAAYEQLKEGTNHA